MQKHTSKDLQEIGKKFVELCETIAALRHPVTGCPWDLEQTHTTLRKYMIEEAYEAAEVMDPIDPKHLQEELGDVLLQVVLNSQIASERSDFSIGDVVSGLNEKMRRRHPHVFGSDEQKKNRSKDAIKNKWDEVKKAEKPENGEKSGVFSTIKAGSVTPSLQKSVAIGKLAKKINFDWSNATEVMKQFISEVDELNHELTSTEPGAKNRAYEELGDVFFSLGQVCRHLDIDPEICAMDGNRKFLRRFRKLEELARREGLDVSNTDVANLERLWIAAKMSEKTK